MIEACTAPSGTVQAFLLYNYVGRRLPCVKGAVSPSGETEGLFLHKAIDQV